MKQEVYAKIRKIEQAGSQVVLWTFHIDLEDIEKSILREHAKKKWKEYMSTLVPVFKGKDLVIKMNKPSSDHPFTYLYETLVSMFTDKQLWVLNPDVKNKISNINNPWALSTFILNEFFAACMECTSKWIHPFKMFNQKRDVQDIYEKVAVKKAQEINNVQDNYEEPEDYEYQEDVEEVVVPQKKIQKAQKQVSVDPTSTSFIWWIPWLSNAAIWNAPELPEMRWFWTWEI